MRCAIRGGWMVLLAMAAGGASADEGMWLFNQPPRPQLKERYGFQPSDDWLTHLQRSAVRFNSGGSGAFVSADGLVMTNHHVGADALQKLSTAQRDLLREGFFARTRGEELRCLDLELNVLMETADVTARVEAAAQAAKTAAEANAARRAAMNTIENESWQKTGLRSDVVTLYHGGAYHLYRMKKYTDVRLVFAPEQAIAFFGGDPDNFEYPRFDLDVCFFRAYEDGKPARPPHHLAWSRRGAADGELVFVAGHPGRTDRLNTVAHLEFLRDRVYPYSLDRIRRSEVLLRTFGERSPENARRAQDELFSYQNARKARGGGLAALQDPALFERKRREEETLRNAANRTGDARTDPWGEVRGAVDAWRAIFYRHDLLEQEGAFRGQLFPIARDLVRLAAEQKRPNAQRLREYRESNLDSLRQQLFSEAPIYADLETLQLGDSLGLWVETAGMDDPLVRKALQGKSPRQRAAELVAGSRLTDVAVRRRLAEGSEAALDACGDPLVELARLVDAESRAVRKRFETEVEEPMRRAYAQIARERFRLHGESVYPDATFTLRLAFGVLRGYEDQGQRLPPWTTYGGLFDRWQQQRGRPPFDLPPRWLERRARLDPQTPLNFVATADIIGGNSGSPVVDRRGEVVGLIFDGNLQTLGWDFVYDDRQGRAIAVDARGIIEALEDVYDAGPLVEELRR